MASFRKSNRTVHRWVSPAFLVTVVITLVYTGTGGDEQSLFFRLFGVVLVGSLLALVVSGSIMWVQHYRPRRRAPWKEPARAVDGASR